MSEQNKSRSMEEIQKEYSQICFKAGQLQYQIHALNKDLEVVNSTLRDLNFEAAKVNAETKAAEEKKAE